MNFWPFNLSKQGATHIKNNKICQDASFSFRDEKKVIVVVCDGHGGEDYIRSDVGAKFAADITGKLMQEFLDKITFVEIKEKNNELLVDLQNDIIQTWNEAVLSHYRENVFTVADLENVSEKYYKNYEKGKNVENAYGTTLVAFGMTSEFCFGLHIGDGKCVVVDTKGGFSEPIPWDSRCFLNATTSLCDDNALVNFRNYFSKELPIAVFLSTDGIDDSFNSSEVLYNFYKTILYSFARESFEQAVEDLEDYLPRLSAKGSGDDVSLSAIFELDSICELDFVKNFDVEAEKARVKENERQEQERIEKERVMMETKFDEVNKFEEN